jgi:uncharacterized membrane protein
MEENFTELVSNRSFELSEKAQVFLKEIAKWSCFLSILGFVFIGLIVLLAFFIGTIFSKLTSISAVMKPVMGIGTGFFSLIYLLIALLYFFLIYYLFQFSSKIKIAFRDNDIDHLNASFEYLKSHYKSLE